MLELSNALYKLNVLFVLLCFNFSETVRLSVDPSRTPILCEGRGGGSLPSIVTAGSAV